MISFRPLTQRIAQRMRQNVLDLESEAVDRWTVSPASQITLAPAVYLPGQLEKIRRTEFAPIDVVLESFRGDRVSFEDETVGFRAKHVDFVDGVLYGAKASRAIRSRRHRRPFYRVPDAVISGAMYETWIGNRWFGSWLMEDCVSYQLAHEHGQPVASLPPEAPSPHVVRYEQMLQMNAARVNDVHFEELVFFRDHSINSGKRHRANRMRERLVSTKKFVSHPGVFLLRGNAGDKRILLNEAEVADGLMSKRGFTVLDPMKATPDEIVEACAGARVVAGVEGSQLCHGLVSMPSDAALFVIQPPERVGAVLKMATDRRGQLFSFVVGSGGSDEFTVAMNDVERTLDLLPQ